MNGDEDFDELVTSKKFEKVQEILGQIDMRFIYEMKAYKNPPADV